MKLPIMSQHGYGEVNNGYPRRSFCIIVTGLTTSIFSMAIALINSFLANKHDAVGTKIIYDRLRQRKYSMEKAHDDFVQWHCISVFKFVVVLRYSHHFLYEIQ